MNEAQQLLDLIEENITIHGGDLGGWTRRDDDALQLFDGRVTLRAEVVEPDESQDTLVHAHVLTTLHDHDDEVLDACVIGMGKDREEAVRQAAGIWMMAVAGPIKSFIDDTPVCMSSAAGEYVDGKVIDYGLVGLRAFVGSPISRGIADESVSEKIDENCWFPYAGQSAAPRRVHLAKATLLSTREEGWSRDLEIDGHELSHKDTNWPVGVKISDIGYMTRFAVFEFPRDSSEIERRAELDRTITHFIQNYSKFKTLDELKESMLDDGFDAEMIHDVESISTIAFSRMFFASFGVQYPTHVIRPCRDGRVEPNAPLMSFPAYPRGRAIATQLFATMSREDVQALSFYNAESHCLLNALNARAERNLELDLKDITLFPSVVAEYGVSDETMDKAIAQLRAMASKVQPPSKSKPWWKFW